MFNKKAEIPMLKTIAILLLTVVIFTSFVILLIQAQRVNIDEKNIKTQLIVNKLFNSKCFSNSFGTIEESKFKQDNLDECYKNIEKDNTMQFRLSIYPSKSYIYGNKILFNENIGFCNIIQSNQQCTKIIYPITYIDAKNEISTQNLIVEIITK